MNTTTLNDFIKTLTGWKRILLVKADVEVLRCTVLLVGKERPEKQKGRLGVPQGWHCPVKERTLCPGQPEFRVSPFVTAPPMQVEGYRAARCASLRSLAERSPAQGFELKMLSAATDLYGVVQNWVIAIHQTRQQCGALLKQVGYEVIAEDPVRVEGVPIPNTLWRGGDCRRRPLVQREPSLPMEDILASPR